MSTKEGYIEQHTKDADCAAMIGEDDVCTVCGVWHGDPCPQCGGRGFHADECPEVRS